MNENDEIKRIADLLYNDYVIKGWKNISDEQCEKQAIMYLHVKNLVEN